jgi:hypothetical protein
MPNEYNVDMTLGDLLKDKVAGKWLRENLKDLVDNPQAKMAMGFSLRQIQQFTETMAPGQFTKKQLEEVDAALRKL